MYCFQYRLFICLLIAAFCSVAGPLAAQIPTDSLSKIHSPRKASIYSAVLPGAGQAYNKKYWKIPVIYAGFGVLGYFVKTNNDEYKIYKNAYKFRLDGDESTVDQFVGIYADQDLVTLKNFYRRNRDLSIIGMSVLYILNIIDASVDAHLFHFNVSDDLTLQVEPSLQYGLNTHPSVALRMKF